MKMRISVEVDIDKKALEQSGIDLHTLVADNFGIYIPQASDEEEFTVMRDFVTEGEKDSGKIQHYIFRANSAQVVSVEVLD